MDAGDDNGGIEAAEQQAGEPTGMGDQRAEQEGDAVAQRPAGGADKQQGDKPGDHDRQERRQDQIQRVGDHLAQVFFQQAHEPHRQQHRKYRALIADHGDLQTEEVHGMEPSGDAPGVGQRRVRQNAAERGAQIGVAAEFTGGGETDQNRQDNERRRAEHVQHHEQRAVGIRPAIGFHHAEQPHQQAGGDDGRDDRHEDVRQQAGDALQRVELFRRDIGGFGFAGFADARRLDEFRMHLVDQPGAEDHLDLTGVAEAAFDAVQFADGLFVHLAVVHQHQAQARGAVGGAGDVLFTAEQRQQRVGGCDNVHVVPLLN